MNINDHCQLPTTAFSTHSPTLLDIEVLVCWQEPKGGKGGGHLSFSFLFFLFCFVSEREPRQKMGRGGKYHMKRDEFWK